MHNLFNTLSLLSSWGAAMTLVIIYCSPNPLYQHAALAINSPTIKIWLGLQGSCMQQEESDIECTPTKFNPVYDLSLLPEDAPAFVLEGPPIIFRLFALVTLISLWMLGALATFTTLYSWRPNPVKWIKFGAHTKLIERWLLRAAVYLAFFNIVVGPLNYKLMDLYFRAMRQHFNVLVAPIHPEIIASIGTIPTYVYVCNALAAFPGIMAGVKIHLEDDERRKAEKARRDAAATEKKKEQKPAEAGKEFLDFIHKLGVKILEVLGSEKKTP